MPSSDTPAHSYSVIDFSTPSQSSAFWQTQPMTTQVTAENNITAHEGQAIPLQQGHGFIAQYYEPGQYQANAPSVLLQPAHMVKIEDGIVELFIHVYRNGKYIGARYFDANGDVLREDRFIKKLDDYAFPGLGTSYSYNASDAFVNAQVTNTHGTVASSSYPDPAYTGGVPAAFANNHLN